MNIKVSRDLCWICYKGNLLVYIVVKTEGNKVNQIYDLFDLNLKQTISCMQTHRVNECFSLL
jgi:hypothetical protein